MEQPNATATTPPAETPTETIVAEPQAESSDPSGPPPTGPVPEVAEAEATDWWGGGLGGWVSAQTFEKAVSSVTLATNSAVQVAKDRSNEVYGFVSKDLGEVSATATNVVGSTASTLKKSLEWDWYYCDPNQHSDMDIPVPLYSTEDWEPLVEPEEEFDEKTDVMADKAVNSVKKSVTSFWKYASGYANQMFEQDDLEAEALLLRGDNPILLDRLQAQLHALAADPNTFSADPDAKDLAKWEEWTCDLDKRQGEISDLMVNNPDIRQHYTVMVPEQVSHKIFWRRYFFKVHLIELQEAKRQALKKRAERIERDSESGINWDDVDDLAQNDISDEVQDKLLSEYEKEIKSKKPEDPKTLTADMAKVNIQSNRSSPEEKESNASDDWEKLSSGEKSPKKGGKEEDEWEEP